MRLHPSQEVVSWQRPYLRRLLRLAPSGAAGAAAAEIALVAPETHELHSLIERQKQELLLLERGGADAAAADAAGASAAGVAEAGVEAGPEARRAGSGSSAEVNAPPAAAAAPPPRPFQSRSGRAFAPDSPVIVMLDLEVRGHAEEGTVRPEIQQISAMAVRRLAPQQPPGQQQRSEWDAGGGGYDWSHTQSAPRDGLRGLCDFLAAAGSSSSSDGSSSGSSDTSSCSSSPAAAPPRQTPTPVVVLAHNGPGFDFVHLFPALERAGLQLPPCVASLLDSRQCFVMGIEKQLKGKWSLGLIHGVRIGQPIPHAHTARGDTAAMLRIFLDVARREPERLAALEARWVPQAWCTQAQLAAAAQQAQQAPAAAPEPTAASLPATPPLQPQLPLGEEEAAALTPQAAEEAEAAAEPQRLFAQAGDSESASASGAPDETITASRGAAVPAAIAAAGGSTALSSAQQSTPAAGSSSTHIRRVTTPPVEGGAGIAGQPTSAAAALAAALAAAASRGPAVAQALRFLDPMQQRRPQPVAAAAARAAPPQLHGVRSAASAAPVAGATRLRPAAGAVAPASAPGGSAGGASSSSGAVNTQPTTSGIRGAEAPGLWIACAAVLAAEKLAQLSSAAAAGAAAGAGGGKGDSSRERQQSRERQGRLSGDADSGRRARAEQ